MTHANAPLNIEERRRLVERCRTHPIAHVAAEAGVSRACLSKWKNRYDTHGEVGLQDRPSVPRSSPAQTPPDVVERIERLRRDNKWSARQITLELAGQGVQISERTVGRWLAPLGINHLRFHDPDGSANRRPSKRIVARYPGHMVHLDVKDPRRRRVAGGGPTVAAPSRPGPHSARRPVAPGAGTSTCTLPSTDSPAWPTPSPFPMRRPPPPWRSTAAPARSSPPTAFTGSCAWSPTTAQTTAPQS